MMIVVRVIADGLFYTVTLSRAMVTETRPAGHCSGEKPLDDLIDIASDSQDRFHAQCLEDVLRPGTHSTGNDQLDTFLIQKSGNEPRLVPGIWDDLLAYDPPIDDIYDREDRAMPEMGKYFIAFC